MHILILNVGSSSLKFAVFNNQEKLFEENRQKVFTQEDRQNTIHDISQHLADKGITIDAVGHRVVHGGEFSASCELTADKVDLLKKYSSLAPLHNPPIVQVIEAAEKEFNEVKHYGVFDTSFYADMPDIAREYAIPHEYFEEGIKRYGFHGTSHRFVSRGLEGKVITCHLGNGASVTAIKDGRAVDTSMGFTPLEGLVMGTRCGDLDPAIIEYMIKTKGMSVDEAFEVLQKKSGLLGVSGGISNDCYDLECSDEEGAKRAIDLSSYRLTRYVGAYTAVMNGLDTLVFTAGIGEKSFIIREYVCEHLGYLGLKMDKEANNKNAPVISTPDSKVKVMVIPTNEDAMIVEDVMTLSGAKN